MFVSGLEIDLIHFRQVRYRSILFGLVTTGVPLLLGIAIRRIFGYQPISAVVIGLLLESHTSRESNRR
jgi:Kef-type K+ transport system membrane component KefB